MIKLKNKTYLVIFGLGLNLFFSQLALSAVDTVGTQHIDPCEGIVGRQCIFMTIPDLQSTEYPVFLDQDAKNIFFHTSQLQSLKVIDSITSGGFFIDANISPFHNISNSSIISYNNIGILSFNQSSSNSVDSTPADGNIVSEIDPVVRGFGSEPFSLNEVSTLETNGSNTEIDSKYTYFSGNGANSNTINLISAPAPGPHLGIHQVGLGFVVKIPANAPTFIKEGTYSSTLTITLTEI